MSTAPVGWTQDVTNNDRVIRVVSGTGTGTGGSWTISGLSNSSTALTQANMPNYNLTVTDPGHIHGVTDPGHNHTVTDNSYFGGGGSSGVVGGPTGFNFPQISTNTTGISIQSHTTGITVSSGGSGTGHTHTPSSDGSWRPAYVDMIVCTKN